MGRKTKFPLRNLFYWSAFCVALSLLLISNAKASLLSDVSNAKNSNPKKSTISFSAFAKKAIFFGQSIVDTGANLGKTFTNDIKDFGATVGNSMDSVGSTFESSIKDGENSVAGLFNATQKTIKEKIGKISVKAAQPVRADQREEAALKAKTVEKKITVKEQVTASFLQTGLNKIKNISKKAVDAGADFGQTLSHDIKDFGATVGNSMDSVGSTFESSIKEGTDGVVELVDAAKSKIGQLADKINPSADEQPAVKNIAVESGVVVGPKQKTTDNGLQTTATTNKTSDTATVQTKKTTLVVTPTTISKSQLTVYSNSETKKEVAKALAPQTNNSNETKAAKTETPADETKTAADSANGITTLQDIKIIGTVDFSNAKVTGLQQTVVNNYSSGPSMTVYNEKDKKNEEWTMLSGAGGGVSHGFSVGTNLSVGKNTDSTSGDITATRNITAGGNITASGSGNFGSLTMSSIIASGNSNVSGTLQVTNTTTLYNDLLVGAAAESISDPGFIFNGNDAYFHDKIGVNGIAYFDNTLQASSTLLVGTAAGTDNLFVNGNNTYVATSTAAGTAYSLVVGNGTTGAVIAGGHVSPSHTGLFDLGRNGLGWNNLFTSSTIYTGAGGTSLSTLSPNILAFA
ncbi:MAG: hypothetical protein HZC26_03015, partial [Candidatus Magasanikbacteria bacterium]|nr:hypothetical protein [Candidatus Magasanikbacteria bacterium]